MQFWRKRLKFLSVGSGAQVFEDAHELQTSRVPFCGLEKQTSLGGFFLFQTETNFLLIKGKEVVGSHFRENYPIII